MVLFPKIRIWMFAINQKIKSRKAKENHQPELYIAHMILYNNAIECLADLYEQDK